MSRYHKSTRIAVLATLGTVCIAAGANAQSAITIEQLAGPWQISIVGNTGCGRTSMLFTGTLNASGTAAGTLTSASGCGTSRGPQTFTITSLDTHGSGTATLSCGSGCGWNFDIQVAANKQMFNLVDFANGSANVLAGTAVAEVESAPPITIDQLSGPWQISIAGNTGCGQTAMRFIGTLSASGTATGTLISASGCGTSSSTQTFTITSLNANGSGAAALSCGSGCGWNFEVQVAANKQMFNLVDFANGSSNVLAGAAVAEVESAITIDQLVAPWQISLIGNTGCGPTSLLFTGTLNASGTAAGTLTSTSGCGTRSSAQTFTITSLNPDGSGTASLGCGPGCGWNFDIQAAANKQLFNLVDSVNRSANVLAGIAVAEAGFVIAPDLSGDFLSEAEAAVQAVGLRLNTYGSGEVFYQRPAAGTSVPAGSVVTVYLNNNSNK